MFNFAQGAMVTLAALSVVGCMEGAPLWLAIILALCHHDRLRHRHREVRAAQAGQPAAHRAVHGTIGLAFFIEDWPRCSLASEPRCPRLGIVDEPIAWFLDEWNMVMVPSSTWSRRVASVLVATLALFFQYTRRSAIALRAVATTTRPRCRSASRCRTSGPSSGGGGFVALVAGMMWGARNGVQFALTFTALEGAAGVDPRRLHLGAGRHRRRPDHRRLGKLAEIYIPPVMQDLFGGNFGGIEGWFPYVLALLFLLVRPEVCSAKNTSTASSSFGSRKNALP